MNTISLEPRRAQGGGDPTSVESALRGETLYGDDFDPEQIRQWFEDEERGYFNLGAGDKDRYSYKYHALNQRHAWRHLPERRYRRVLGFGSAYGDELRPIAASADHITIMEPADGFAVDRIAGTPVAYVKPRPDGLLPFADGKFDLITAFAVLHHIPNVSTVVAELSRCLSPEGFMLLREPIVSMGDWRKPRPGLTRRERGIPLSIFRRILETSGLTIMRERLCAFSITSQLAARWPVYSSRSVVWLDEWVSGLPLWPARYHATRMHEKLRPTAVAYVLRHRTRGPGSR
ncbi:MAG TPA: class I SAM-dependent methyltransferase [Candidatus Eisenbacteria bacterium]|nr:class I SAM-dependent methyltransferase [Candidatus Eisenbacteria bacterium]